MFTLLLLAISIYICHSSVEENVIAKNAKQNLRKKRSLFLDSGPIVDPDSREDVHGKNFIDIDLGPGDINIDVIRRQPAKEGKIISDGNKIEGAVDIIDIDRPRSGDRVDIDVVVTRPGTNPGPSSGRGIFFSPPGKSGKGGKGGKGHRRINDKEDRTEIQDDFDVFDVNGVDDIGKRENEYQNSQLDNISGVKNERLKDNGAGRNNIPEVSKEMRKLFSGMKKIPMILN